MNRGRAEALRLYAIKEDAAELVCDIVAKGVCEFFDDERVQIKPRENGKIGFNTFVASQKIAFSVEPAYCGQSMKPLALFRYRDGSMYAKTLPEGIAIFTGMTNQAIKHRHDIA